MKKSYQFNTYVLLFVFQEARRGDPKQAQMRLAVSVRPMLYMDIILVLVVTVSYD